jgi:hypothetical protein
MRLALHIVGQLTTMLALPGMAPDASGSARLSTLRARVSMRT